jgi:tryptophan 2,3-dioxygenase
MASDESAALTYASYLALDDVLGAQRPRSEEHDELLFIVIHQVYELWFKQLLHELAYLQRRLEMGDSSRALGTLKRVLTILKTVVAQIDVLETMTPRQFTTFRDRLDAASGFQSAQFRELEAVLGSRDRGAADRYPPESAARERIADAMARPSLLDSFLRYLAAQGFGVPRDVLTRDVTEPLAPSQAVQDVLVDVYRVDGPEVQVCERLIDVDEGLQEWRYRHVKMVERTIGDKAGTGGSTGAEYLRTTLFQAAFPDLWAVRRRL